MATIKPIEGRSVHQIQSGQVIVDLCSVVKELVENGLDAGATTIDVRFRNNGLDSIEVQDNGSGIAPDDYDTIALKHYTSKLSSYDDLSALQTFGFRGEALSSLCALSKFHIVTARAVDAPKGTRLDFEISGKLKGTSVVASQKGTTVVVESLFYNLPVRRKELEKTVKREYGKVLGLLHAYACISTGVKFSVSNQMPKGKKTVAFSTNSNPNTKENIANVYGAKTLSALIPLDLKFEMDPTVKSTQSGRNRSTQEDSGSKEVCIVGHISRPVVGEGRQTPDRQMFFVNSRPCGLPQVAKAFNEVYKSYNVTQSPFIFADIRLDTNAYDVNVSPDKRTILLHDQMALLESLKTSLVELFEAHDQSVPQNQLPQLAGRKLSTYKQFTGQRSSTVPDSEEDKAASDSAGVSKRKLSESQPSLESASSETAEDDRMHADSLLSKFAGRDVEDRSTRLRSVTRPRSGASKESGGFRPASELVSRDEDGLFVSSRSPSPAESERLPKPVEDFNARLESQRKKRLSSERSSNAAASDNEESVPRIQQTPQSKSSQSTIQNAFDRMRPMRTPVQQATITVGDTTTVSTIGSSVRSSKRARIHTPKFGLDGTPLSQTPKKPLLIKSLKGFFAPGTQAPSDDGDAGEEETRVAHEDADPDSSMPDAPGAFRSPSLRERRIAAQTVTVRQPTEQREGLSDEGAGLSVSRACVQEEQEGEELNVQMVDAAEPIEEGPRHSGTDGSDDEYIDESEKKAREEAKIAKMIEEAEEAAARPSEDNLKRAAKLLKGPRKGFKTLELTQCVETSVVSIKDQQQALQAVLEESESDTSENTAVMDTQLSAANPEERLSLTVSKSDFMAMRIIGQFNLGFILAVRPPTRTCPTHDLFIIDQHASDEKYNFERFTASTILVPQRLVHPRPLELTAIEEEIILNSKDSLTANGFIVSMDISGASPVGSRARLLSLPMSKEVTFTPTDLEELLALLAENPPSYSPCHESHIPRPSKVRKLLASRACRSSVMVGKTMKERDMERVVRHMGEMSKPWSCPHGRPTMRHLFGLEGWRGWKEGMGLGDERSEGDEGVERTDWGGWLNKREGGRKRETRGGACEGLGGVGNSVGV
ncbi:DNA mismatch repair protein MutL [Delitschia confertaspora ATCC 74209]|uniref:DNA mismatch repair protein PMS1 n=1 Tax=Delitschia confertaspora ATCC 74209 TaxID=1513339 RepID=A0A9P4JV42_9PLEO|nr:DNA mismatch repair protein MutL [Delitschia confertaspora ATCC 74209]